MVVNMQHVGRCKRVGGQARRARRGRQSDSGRGATRVSDGVARSLGERLVKI